MAVTYVERNSSLFYIPVTVGDTNQDITTEQEAEKLIEECLWSVGIAAGKRLGYALNMKKYKFYILTFNCSV